MTSSSADNIPVEQVSAISARAAESSSAAWDYCRPAAPVPGETEAETRERYQRSVESLANCFNAELKVRPETSLLSFLIIKIIIPFTAISVALSTFYARMITRADARYDNAEYGLGVGYFVIAILFIVAWRVLRNRDVKSKERKLDQSVQSFLNFQVPPTKEKLTRNPVVNGWIYFCLTFGVIVLLPLMFLLFRSNAFERVGFKVVLDTAGICEPAVNGYNPYEGSDTCIDSGYTYTSAPVETGSQGSLGDGQFNNDLGVNPSTNDAYINNVAEVRLDVTTTLVLYFLILIVGIVVSMLVWWRRDRNRKRKRQEATIQPSLSGL